jgi:hypothetical protein
MNVSVSGSTGMCVRFISSTTCSGPAVPLHLTSAGAQLDSNWSLPSAQVGWLASY